MGWYVIIVGLNCICPIINDVWIFSCTCWILWYIFFGKYVYLDPLPNFQSDWLAVCFAVELIASLYILDINPFSDNWLENVFFNSIVCLFILLTISFAMQKIFSLIVLPCIFCFCCLAFLGQIKNHCDDCVKELTI